MDWISSFWGTRGEDIVAGIAIIIGAAAAGWVLLRVWKVVWMILRSILGGIYWLLIGWWVARIRRAITGDPW